MGSTSWTADVYGKQDLLAKFAHQKLLPAPKIDHAPRIHAANGALDICCVVVVVSNTESEERKRRLQLL